MRKAILCLLLLAFCGSGFSQEKPVEAKPLTSISVEDFRQRLEELKAVQIQVAANLQAIGGAIQDCEFWIDLLERAKKQAETKAVKTEPVKEKPAKEDKNGNRPNDRK
jgi:hypothetical protein